MQQWKLNSRRIKPFGLGVAVVLLYFAGPGMAAIGAAQESVLVNRIVAEVNEDIITLYELNQAAAPFIRRVRTMGRPLSEEREMLYEVREKMLNKLIDDKLTDQEVRRYNISISEEAIDNTIEEIKKRSLMTDQQLRAGLNKEGITIDEYRQEIKTKMLRTRLVNRQVKSKIVITDEDIRAVYEQNKADYGGEELYRLRQIIISPAGGQLEAQQKMEMILIELDEGAAFADLARTYSDGPAAGDGGLLGEFKLADMADTIRSALKGLKAGEHTSIMETSLGLQLFYVDDIRFIAGKTLEQSTSDIEGKLYDQIVNRKFAAWLTELRERSHIKIIR